MSKTAVQKYPSQFRINRLPADDDELWWTIYAMWGYRIPRTRVCPHHTPPFQALADAYFARYPSMIWKASRGLGGKSRTLAVLGLTEAALLGIEVTILGGSFAQSKNVHDATKNAWDWHAAPKALLVKSNQFETTMTNDGLLHTLTASQTSVRGPHPPRLRMDEIDEMDQDILDAALGQPMEQEGIQGYTIPTQTVMSSTHQYPDKAMATMIARANERGWPVYEWCYRETSNPTDGWLTQGGIQRAREVVSQHMWDTEYDLQEPSFAGRAIDTECVEKCFVEEWGVFDGESQVFTPKQEGRYYVTAVDWAKHRDYTIIATFDTTERPWRCVAWHKFNQLPWPLLVGRAIRQWRMYGDKFVHDATGVGDVVHDLIREKCTSGEWARVKGVVMGGGRERDALYEDYIAGIEHDDIRYPRILFAYNEHKYVTPDALFTNKEHAPDSVVTGALAWSTRKQHITVVKPDGGRRGSNPWEI